MSIKSVKWLTTLDLENFVFNYADVDTKTAFLGVFPINYLPRRLLHLPALLIINTNTDNLPGQHWKAIYVSTNRIGEVFDSLATPISLQLEQWMNEFTLKWTLSKMTLQNPLSPSCGGYVLYYVLNRLKHNSMKSCMAPFTNNVLVNDAIAEDFFQQMLQ